MSLDSMFQAAVRKPVKFKTKKKQPALTEQEVLRRRAENMRRSPTGQVLETYQGPDTFGGAVYDAFGRVMGGLRGLTGGDEHTAANARFEAEDQLRGIGEFLLGPEELQRAARSVKLGNAGGGDYATLGLAALPFVPKPVKKVARLAVSKAGSAAAKAVPKAARTFMTEARPLVDDAADFIEGKFSVRPPAAAPQQPRVATSYAVPRRVEGPAPRQALPAPGPGLPAYAAKPRGGQWWADKYIGAVRPSDLGVKVGRLPDDGRWFVKDGEGRLMLFDTEDQARSMSQHWVDSFNKNASVERAVRRIADSRLGLVSDANGPLSQLQSWFLRAAPRYIKNDMGTAEDPMRALAERGALHVAMSPDEWSQAASDVIKGDTIGDVLGLNQLYPKKGAMPGAGDDFRASVVTNMPWLTKAPVTDQLYRIGDTHTLEDKMGLAHILDEMRNAMHERSDLPADLAVRPESLQRMGLPQAAEHVGKINQFRAKQAEQAALDAQNNPVTHVFKEYTENNPRGLRWVEMAPPKSEGPANYDVEEELRKALKYEGDTMGHCVGGYCPDVMSGQSRIFSLRDAKGEPHVTIETQPGDAERFYRDRIMRLRQQGLIGPDDYPGMAGWEHFNALLKKAGEEPLDLSVVPQNIKQIKGKQNRAPNDEYLPFVQDFVKSQQWGNVGDLGNTGLTRLPDGRYLTPAQIAEALSGLDASHPRVASDVRWLSSGKVGSEDGLWEQYMPYFEGYAIGGKVDADRCFCRHPLSVKGKK